MKLNNEITLIIVCLMWGILIGFFFGKFQEKQCQKWAIEEQQNHAK